MNCRLAAAGNVRPKGKCYSMAGSLFFMSMLPLLLLLIAQAAARPADEGDETLSSDADNIEYHHVKIVDGVMHEDHPIVMYKEDFVSEDFDPNKSKTQKNYKSIVRQQRPNHTEQYNVLKPEKLYFDVLPQAPIVVEEDGAADSKFDASQIHAELVPLMSDDNIANNEDELAESKSALSKRPKKYHSRHRRATYERVEHKVQKRNPYYRVQVGYIYPRPQPVGQYGAPVYYAVARPQSQPAQGFVRHPVQGKRPNHIQAGRLPESVGSRGDFEDRVWGSRPNNNRPTLAPAAAPVATPPSSLWHDSNPENFDFSVYETTPRPLTDPSNTIDRRPPPAFAQSSVQPTRSPWQSQQSVGNSPTGGKIHFPTKRLPSNSNTVCGRAEPICCTQRDLGARFICFHSRKCVLSIAEIMAMCE